MGSESYFRVGGRYENRLGWYTVVRVASGTTMAIRYDNGAGTTIDDLSLQERIVKRLAAEREAEHATPPKLKAKPQHGQPSKDWRRDPATPTTFFFGLGFLACRARIEAHVPKKSQRTFEQDYTLHTGQTAVPGQDMYYLFADPDIKKWGPDLRVAWRGTLAEADSLNFGPKIEIRYHEDIGEWRINKSVFIRDLFTRGFRLGTHQDVEGILARVPEPYQDAFRQGAASARERRRRAA